MENIFFDLDGTLTDSQSGILNSVRYALEKMQLQDGDPESLRSFIGPPLYTTFKTRYLLSDEDTDRAVACYREYFSEKGLFENELYPGIAELLQRLSNRGRRLYVVTSKPGVYAKRIISHFDLEPVFDGIIGSRLDNTMTDKAALIAFTLRQSGLKAERTSMVGDRKYDILGAKENRVASIGVTYGYGSVAEIEENAPDHIIHTVAALEQLLLTNN